MNNLLTGANVMASMVIALVFLRYWRSAHDRFFLYFALSFAIEGMHRLASALIFTGAEDTPLHYLIRLVAYGLILWAIIEKNIRRKPASQ